MRHFSAIFCCKRFKRFLGKENSLARNSRNLNTFVAIYVRKFKYDS